MVGFFEFAKIVLHIPFKRMAHITARRRTEPLHSGLDEPQYEQQYVSSLASCHQRPLCDTILPLLLEWSHAQTVYSE